MNSVKLKYGNKVIENIIPGTSVYEVSKLVQGDFKYPIIGAKIDNLNVDLNDLIMDNGTIEFFDNSFIQGNVIYERSLELLIIAASHEVLSSASDILINYSLDGGIYCEVEGQKITSKTV